MSECAEVFYDQYFEQKLDKNPFLIAFKNGVYDLKTNMFRDGLPCDHLSKQLPINYNNTYTRESPEIKEIEYIFETLFPNVELRRYFLSINSRIFCGKITKMFQIWKGTGCNGKSLLEKIFERLLGDMCAKLPTSLITGKRTQSGAASPELLILNGARMAFLQECTGEEQMNTGLLKELTGGDSIYCRGLNRDPIRVEPMFQLIVACNSAPKMSGSATDLAVWRRIKIMKFESYFPEEPSKVPPTKELQLEKTFPRDTTLDERIDDLLEPMAWYLLECYKNDYYKNVPEPNIVIEETNIYQNDNDIINQFVKDYVQEAPGKTLSINTMYIEFKGFFSNAVPGTKIMPKASFQSYFIQKWGEPKKPGYYYEDKDLSYKA